MYSKVLLLLIISIVAANAKAPKKPAKKPPTSTPTRKLTKRPQFSPTVKPSLPAINQTSTLTPITSLNSSSLLKPSDMCSWFVFSNCASGADCIVGNSYTFSSTTGVASTINAYGFSGKTAYVPDSRKEDLYPLRNGTACPLTVRNKPGTKGEPNGLGIFGGGIYNSNGVSYKNPPVCQTIQNMNEIAPNFYVQFDVSDVNLDMFNSMHMSFTSCNTLHSNQRFAIYGSDTFGVLGTYLQEGGENGIDKLGFNNMPCSSVNAANREATTTMVAIAGFKKYKYLSVTGISRCVANCPPDEGTPLIDSLGFTCAPTSAPSISIKPTLSSSYSSSFRPSDSTTTLTPTTLNPSVSSTMEPSSSPN